MIPLDDYIIALSIIVTVALYFWLLSAYRSFIRALDLLGSALVIAFIVLLISSAVLFQYGIYELSNRLSVYAFFAVLIGVIVKAAAQIKGS